MKRFLAVLLFLWVSQVALFAAAVPFQPGFTGFFDFNGQMLIGGHVYFYAAGTTTPKTVYTTSTMGTAASNPSTLDAYGRVTVYGNGSYFIKVFDSVGVEQGEWDNVELLSTLNPSSQTVGSMTVTGLLTAAKGAIASGTFYNAVVQGLVTNSVITLASITSSDIYVATPTAGLNTKVTNKGYVDLMDVSFDASVTAKLATLTLSIASEAIIRLASDVFLLASYTAADASITASYTSLFASSTASYTAMGASLSLTIASEASYFVGRDNAIAYAIASLSASLSASMAVNLVAQSRFASSSGFLTKYPGNYSVASVTYSDYDFYELGYVDVAASQDALVNLELRNTFTCASTTAWGASNNPQILAYFCWGTPATPTSLCTDNQTYLPVTSATDEVVTFTSQKTFSLRNTQTGTQRFTLYYAIRAIHNITSFGLVYNIESVLYVPR